MGLQEAFRSVFPIKDFRGECALHFVDYSLGDWQCRCGFVKGLEHLRQTCSHCKGRVIVLDTHVREVQCQHCGQIQKLDLPKCPHCDDVVNLRVHAGVDECQERGMTFGVPLKIRVRLEVYQKDAGGQPSVLDIKEEEVFFGNMPLMTEKGTFIINGTERVVVSQLHRSPGVFFQTNDNRTEYVSKIIPARGSWVELELDAKGLLHVRIDRKRRFPATVFLRALGLGENSALLSRFYPVDTFQVQDGKIRMAVSDRLHLFNAAQNVKDGRERWWSPGKKIRRSQIARLKKMGVESVLIDHERAHGHLRLQGRGGPGDGRRAGRGRAAHRLRPRSSRWPRPASPPSRCILPKATDIGVALLETITRDVCKNQEDAYLDFFRKVRPGDPVTPEGAKNFFNLMFFDDKRYDFSRVGALKFLTKMHPQDFRSLGKKQLTEELDRRGPSPSRTTARSWSTSSSCRRTSRRWTTSTTWATAASAPWASSSRTRSASVWPAWSARPRRR